MEEKYNFPARYPATDPMRYVPSQRGFKKIIGWILLIIILAALFYLGALAYFWATSPTGERTLSDVYSSTKEYLPWVWYSRQLERAETIGKGGWSAQVNRTESGLIFKGLEAVGSKQIAAGSQIILRYRAEVKNYEGQIAPEFSCSIKNKDIKGQIIPEKSLLSQKKEGNVRCVIDNTNNLSGTTEIIGKIAFPYKTENANLDVYFTTDKVLQTIPEDDNFFDYFGIDIKQPIRTAYNGEPVEIAIGISDTEKQPVILEEGINPIVGLTLTNRWGGRIREISMLRIYLPALVTINEELSRNPTALCPFEKAESNGRYNIYEVSQGNLNLVMLPENTEEQRVTFECWLSVDPAMARGNYAHKNYKADAGYVYELKEKTETVTVMGAEGENVQ